MEASGYRGKNKGTVRGDEDRAVMGATWQKVLSHQVTMCTDMVSFSGGPGSGTASGTSILLSALEKWDRGKNFGSGFPQARKRGFALLSLFDFLTGPTLGGTCGVCPEAVHKPRCLHGASLPQVRSKHCSCFRPSSFIQYGMGFPSSCGPLTA
jgi:hypothetical protein